MHLGHIATTPTTRKPALFQSNRSQKSCFPSCLPLSPRARARFSSYTVRCNTMFGARRATTSTLAVGTSSSTHVLLYELLYVFCLNASDRLRRSLYEVHHILLFAFVYLKTSPNNTRPPPGGHALLPHQLPSAVQDGRAVSRRMARKHEARLRRQDLGERKQVRGGENVSCSI